MFGRKFGFMGPFIMEKKGYGWNIPEISWCELRSHYSALSSEYKVLKNEPNFLENGFFRVEKNSQNNVMK